VGGHVCEKKMVETTPSSTVENCFANKVQSSIPVSMLVSFLG
jgi:hypothetical protein